MCPSQPAVTLIPAQVSTMASVNTAHTDMIHDAQLDFYGKRLATCSSDRTVKIFDIVGEHERHVRDLLGHEGPVWQVAWGHPSFGNLLASGSHDRKVIVWKETPAGWENVKEHLAHESSINSVAWAPVEVGYPLLACGSSDGDITLLRCQDGVWSSQRIPNAHQTGVASVSWAPIAVEQLQPDGRPLIRLVSGGCDNKAKVWHMENDAWSARHDELVRGAHVNAHVMAGDWTGTECTQQVRHTDWVRDVAWSPSLGPVAQIATCSQDGSVLIWSQEITKSHLWDAKVMFTFPCPVWRLSWSVTGTILAVSTQDNKVSLWKESLTGEWASVSEVEDSSARA